MTTTRMTKDVFAATPMRVVLFYPTRFHIFNQLNTPSFAGEDFEIFSIYPPRYFRSGNFSALAKRNKTLWLGLALRGLLHLAARMKAGPKVTRPLRSLYIRGVAAEFVWRSRLIRPALVVASAGYLGSNLEKLKRYGHLVVTNHGSLYEPSVRDRMLKLGGEVRDDGANWTHPELMARMDCEFETADRILLCSPTARDSFPAQLQSRIDVVPLGAPSLSGMKSPARQSDAPSTNFLHVSNLSSGKNAARVLDAFAQIRRPEDRLVIGGPAPRDRALLHRLAEPEPGVSWLGRLDRAGVAKAMAEADIFVHPSFADGWGMVVTEALAAGLPVVASPYTGAASYYAGISRQGATSVLLADPGDTAAIAAAMAALRETLQATPRFASITPISWATSAGLLVQALAPLRELKQ